MTDQQYTPDIDDIIIAYHTYVTGDGTYSQEFEVSRDEVDRALAAAEQRGAEHHLRLAASELNMHHLTEDLSDEALELGVRFINLIQDRADRIANKEGDIA